MVKHIKTGKIKPVTSDKIVIVDAPEDYEYIIIKPMRKTTEILPYCNEKAVEPCKREYTKEDLKKISKKVIKPPKEHPYAVWVREFGELNVLSSNNNSDSGADNFIIKR